MPDKYVERYGTDLDGVKQAPKRKSPTMEDKGAKKKCKPYTVLIV